MQRACMIVHTIRTTISVSIALTFLSESAHYMDGIVYTPMSFFGRKPASHGGLPAPVRITTAFLGSFDATVASNWVRPVSLLECFLQPFRESKNPCAIFTLDVLRHLKQLLFIIYPQRGNPLLVTKMMECFPTAKEALHRKPQAVGHHTNPTLVSVSQRHPKP